MLGHALRRCARATTRGAMTSSAARTRGIASSSAVGDEFRYEPLFDVRAPLDVEGMLTRFAVGLGLCWAVVVFGAAKRLRWAGLALGTAHGGLGILLWTVSGGNL